MDVQLGENVKRQTGAKEQAQKNVTEEIRLMNVKGLVTSHTRKQEQHIPAVYHKATLLLKLYRSVIWRTEESFEELEDEACEMGGKSLAEMMDFLVMDFNEQEDLKKLESRLCSFEKTKYLVEIVDRALLKLKSYPDRGEQYFSIIYKKYISKYPYEETEILESLNLERSTYFRRKKEAINLLGILLWGYVLPQLRTFWANIDTDLTQNCD